MSEDVNELQKEWRAIVLDKLAKLENNQNDLRKDIAEIKASFAQVADVNNLKIEVDKLKDFKSKAVGIIIALNAVGAFIGWAVQTFVHK